jgi:hypothetical protein
MKKFVFAAALTACAATLVSLAPAQAAPDASKLVQPLSVLNQKPALERTPEQMAAFDATFLRPMEEKAEPTPRPTMDAALYQQLKRQAEMAPVGVKPGAGTAAPAPLAATLLKFTGATECDGPGGCWVPPDVAGTIGKSNWVSVSNDVVEIRNRGTGVLQQINSLNGFFGYSTQSMFDPRVQWDEEYQRWVITADAFAESSTVQYLGVAVSQTSSATGKWWIYFTNTNNFTGAGAFYDYPMLGLSQDAVIFTANVFGASAFQGSYLFGVSKARIYNGYGWGVPVYGFLNATLEPGRELLTDQNGYSWLAAAVGSGVNMYAFRSPATPNLSALFGPYSVSGIGAYNLPPAAPQPASCAPAGAKLDSLDGRFQNQGTQNGDLYYQTHTVYLAGFPAPKLYVIKGLSTFAPTALVNNYYYASGSSYDFNPSIAADMNGHFAMNWSSTNPLANILASMYFTDNKVSTPSGPTGYNVFQSASCYTGVGTSRWGDYSQTSVDWGTGSTITFSPKNYWITNETIPSANFWSTEVGKIAY